MITNLEQATEDEVLSVLPNQLVDALRVPETVEETPKDLVRPLLRFPPLATLTLFLILRHGLLRDLQVHDLEEKTAPRDKAVLSLLMLAQLEDDARRVRLED